jgi:hypothetical protein
MLPDCLSIVCEFGQAESNTREEMSRESPDANRSITSSIPPPPDLTTPVRWLVIFGPGAIIASLTIGTGELIFSARAGAIFGYGVLWLFLLTCFLKWILVYTAARHMLLTGTHPFGRHASLPGPRGWFPITLLILAAVAVPIWFGFLSGVLGTLLQTGLGLHGHLWGALASLLVIWLVIRGGYEVLERIQLAIVILLLGVVSVALILMKPDWIVLFRGMLVPSALSYPDWLAGTEPAVASRPVWLEAVTYIGVVAGSGYDYMGYVAFLRHKNWGLSGQSSSLSTSLLSGMSRHDRRLLLKWLRAPLIDSSISFLAVFVFSSVFVALGTIVLAPQRVLPSGDNLLTLQAQFVTSLHPWLLPLYVAGALLAIFGSLYGTTAVAPTVLGEILRAVGISPLGGSSRREMKLIVGWCGGGGILVLGWSYWYRLTSGLEQSPPTLVEIVTPANLFTGVLACGFICLLNPWMDWKFAPKSLRLPTWLALLNLASGVFFCGVGVRGYWDFGVQKLPDWGGGWFGALVFCLTLALGWTVAKIMERRSDSQTIASRKKRLKEDSPRH